MNGTTCTPEEYLSFTSSNGSATVCLTRGESIGLAFVAESALISLLALIGVFCLIIRNALRNGYLIKRPADIYMISLFTFDLIMAISHVLDLRWIHDGKLQLGGYCTAQGAIQQIGETGSALATLAIAVHTVVAVFWGRLSRNLLAAYLISAFIWLFVAIFVAVGVSVNTHGSDHYETPDGYWCWIGKNHELEKYLGEYVWMWAAMFVSFAAYTPLFLWARGNMSIDPTCWWKIRFHIAGSNEHIIDPDGRKRRAMGLIAYPLVFAIIILPLSVVRWTSKFGSTSNSLSAATFATQSLYSLSGACNVVLFLFTRTGLLIPHSARSKTRRSVWWGPKSQGSISMADVEVSEARWAEHLERSGSAQRSSESHTVGRATPVPLKPMPAFDDRSSSNGSIHSLQKQTPV